MNVAKRLKNNNRLDFAYAGDHPSVEAILSGLDKPGRKKGGPPPTAGVRGRATMRRATERCFDRRPVQGRHRGAWREPRRAQWSASASSPWQSDRSS